MSSCDRCGAVDAPDVRTVLINQNKRRYCTGCREDVFSPESGYRSDPQVAIDRIQHELSKRGVHIGEDGPPKQWDWNDAEQRARVRDQFRKNAGSITFDREAPLLSGFGEQGKARHARSDCGEDHPWLCDSCGAPITIGRTCTQSVCSRCAPAWCRDRAIQKTAKLRTFRKEKHWNTPDLEHQKTHHGIISPSLGWYHALARAGLTLEEAQDLTKNIVKEILDEMRIQGALIRHSYRGKHDDGTLADDQDDIGEWRKRVYAGRDWYGDVRDELAWKPHYHIVGVGDCFPTEGFSDRLEAATGWVTHRIVGEDGKSLPTDGAMATATTYCFSHADIRIGEGDAPNQSQIWEVGTFHGQLGEDGGALKSTPKFSANPTDVEWADAKVRSVSERVLGLRSATTDCQRTIPPVDDPDELARQILEDLYPDDEELRDSISSNTVLGHVATGNINVTLSSSSSGTMLASASVGDSFSKRIGLGGDVSPLSKPRVNASGSGTVDVEDADDGDGRDHGQEHGDDCSCGDHDDVDDEASDDQERDCDGELIPLGEARRRGLLEDDEWCRQAAHVDEARETDEEWTDDLDPWRSSGPRTSVGANHVAEAAAD